MYGILFCKPIVHWVWANSDPGGPILIFLVHNMTFLGIPCWFRHFSSTFDARRLQIGLRSTEPPNLPVYFYLLLILHSKTYILNFGKFLLVLLGTLDDQPTLKTHLYKLLIFLQWLNFFTSTPWKIVRPELFQPPNILTQKSAMTKYFKLFISTFLFQPSWKYFNLLFLLWISKFLLKRLLIRPKLFRHTTWIGLLS